MAIADRSLTINVHGGTIHDASPKPYAMVFITRELEDRPRNGKIPRSQLALTTQASRPENQFAIAIAQGQKVDNWDPQLSMSWQDLVALAKGTEQLFLLRKDLRNKDSQVEVTPIDREIILQGERALSDMQARLAAMQADYCNACTYADDLDPPLLLVM